MHGVVGIVGKHATLKAQSPLENGLGFFVPLLLDESTNH